MRKKTKASRSLVWGITLKSHENCQDYNMIVALDWGYFVFIQLELESQKIKIKIGE